jgi:hypothetical protein
MNLRQDLLKELRRTNQYLKYLSLLLFGVLCLWIGETLYMYRHTREHRFTFQNLCSCYVCDCSLVPAKLLWFLNVSHQVPGGRLTCSELRICRILRLSRSQFTQCTCCISLHLIASYCWSITCLLALLSSRNATRLRLTTHFLKAIGAFRRELAYDCGAKLCSFSPHRKSYDAMLPANPCRLHQLHQLHQRGSGRPSHWPNRPTNPTRISCIKLDLFGSLRTAHFVFKLPQCSRWQS